MQININNKYFLYILPLAIVGLIFYYLSDIVAYVVLAWALSMIGAPIVRFFKRFMGKNAAALLTLGVFMIFFMILMWIFIPPLINQARNLANTDYTSVINSLEEPVKDWKNWLIEKRLLPDNTQMPLKEEKAEKEDHYIFSHKILLDSLSRQGDSVVSNQNVALLIKIDASDLLKNKEEAIDGEEKNEDFFENLKSNMSDFLSPKLIQSVFSSIVSAFGNILVAFMSVFFICFFFLREQGLFDNIIAGIVPLDFEGQTREAVSITSELLIRYFIGILLQTTIITVFVSVFLTILGVKNALLIGFFAGFMNIIPYLGPIFGASFGLLITISSNLNEPFYSVLFPIIIKVMIVFAIIQLIDNIILQPNIFSKSVKAHPLEIFIVVLIAGKLGGILGMVLAIPVYTVLRVVGKVFLKEFKVIQNLTKNM
ncbi:MAG: AI-2E family transporter [Saprospiraceae bacterium]|nr:AI-2E family transporter [Saprospiraceae bacterium]MBK7523143.1 AI-2E family transporter [Saprospiraceae bacterium]MBK8547129.1 AI-2E family transporter [Saprospiraceae bacterium]MBK8820283.1 AI-2E family transporter [Saprospiraceae bacterium]